MLEFQNRSFCFTGTMSDLKRSQAEREARARGAQTTDIVNERLDYLVVGSVASIGWKHGDYGRKIERARSLNASGVKTLTLTSEATFIDSLALHSPINAGDIDAQIWVGVYSFIVQGLDSFDRSAVEALLREKSDEGFHVRVSVAEISVAAALFGGETGTGVAVEARFVKQVPLDSGIGTAAREIERRFEGIAGVDGKLRAFARTEGSASYIRLLREIPSKLRIE